MPLGIPSLEAPDALPIALISIKQDNTIKENELFKVIPQRCTSHAVFNDKSVSELQKKELLKTNIYKDEGFNMKIFDSPDMLLKINELMIEAMRIQANTPGPHSETIKMIRFRKKHLHERKDGFSFNDLGVTGLKLKLAENFATPEMENSNFFKKNVVKAIRKMAESAKAYVCIYAPEDTRANQIITGQMFCNAHLRTTSQGLSFQPMDHIFQKYVELTEIEKAMCDLVKISNKIPMAVFRIGYADVSYHTPRRPIEELLMEERAMGRIKN